MPPHWVDRWDQKCLVFLSRRVLLVHLVYCFVLSDVVLCRVVLCCLVLCCIVLCCAVLCCAVLCCVVLCCVVLRCAVLRCAVLSCLVLSCLALPFALACLFLSFHSFHTFSIYHKVKSTWPTSPLSIPSPNPNPTPNPNLLFPTLTGEIKVKEYEKRDHNAYAVNAVGPLFSEFTRWFRYFCIMIGSVLWLGPLCLLYDWPFILYVKRFLFFFFFFMIRRSFFPYFLLVLFFYFIIGPLCLRSLPHPNRLALDRRKRRFSPILAKGLSSVSDLSMLSCHVFYCLVLP